PRPSGGAGSADADTGGARRPGQEREGGVGPYRREDPAPGGDDGEGGGGATSVTERRAWLSGAFGGGDTAGGRVHRGRPPPGEGGGGRADVRSVGSRRADVRRAPGDGVRRGGEGVGGRPGRVAEGCVLPVD
ncbi:hypothetical protein THAOC_33011, partial [Thalassiosira oceanica]